MLWPAEDAAASVAWEASVEPRQFGWSSVPQPISLCYWIEPWLAAVETVAPTEEWEPPVIVFVGAAAAFDDAAAAHANSTSAGLPFVVAVESTSVLVLMAEEGVVAAS